MTQIAKVAVAAATYAIDKPYDYLVPSGMELSVGCRVTVPFGRGNRTAEGMVLQLRQDTTTNEFCAHPQRLIPPFSKDIFQYI